MTAPAASHSATGNVGNCWTSKTPAKNNSVETSIRSWYFGVNKNLIDLAD
jgi:hypothetical protein